LADADELVTNMAVPDSPATAKPSEEVIFAVSDGLPGVNLEKIVGGRLPTSLPPENREPH